MHILARTPPAALKQYMQRQGASFPRALWRNFMQHLAQDIMEIEVANLLAASRYERKSSRRAYRNGYRDSMWETSQATIALRIPKLRSGSYYPTFLDAAEKLFNHFMLDLFIHGARANAIADLLENLDIDASPQQIAQLHESLYDELHTYRQRLLKTPRLWLDSISVDDNGRKRQLALALDENGEIIELELTSSDDDEFWQDFIRRIDGRSLYGVEYVAVGQLRHIMRLKHPRQASMMLMAA